MKTVCTLLFSALSLPLAAQKVVKTKIHSAKMDKNIETIIITPDMQDGINYKTVYTRRHSGLNPKSKNISDDLCTTRWKFQFLVRR